MTHEAPESAVSVLAQLWERAPLWRLSVYSAALLTMAGLLFLSKQDATPLSEAVGHSNAGTISRKSLSVSRKDLITVPDIHPPVGSTPPIVFDAMSSKPPASNPTDAAMIGSTANPQPQVDEETARALARCEPHLLFAPTLIPQIDVSQRQDLRPGRMKINFWINGEGLVIREQLVDANMGSDAERNAELAYTKDMTFTVPNTSECKTREIELIGDFFEVPAGGRWSTYVRLFPRWTFDRDGNLKGRR